LTGCEILREKEWSQIQNKKENYLENKNNVSDDVLSL
jgi:hypothetical protein